jgi:ATP-dependent RNA helicase DHX33
MWIISVYDFREEILSIVALLSSESVFVIPPSKREKAVAAHKKFFSSSGDHITLLNIYRSFSMVTQKKVFTGLK